MIFDIWVLCSTHFWISYFRIVFDLQKHCWWYRVSITSYIHMVPLSQLMNPCAVLSSSVVSNSVWPHGLQSTRLLCPWGFSCFAGRFFTSLTTREVLMSPYWWVICKPFKKHVNNFLHVRWLIYNSLLVSGVQHCKAIILQFKKKKGGEKALLYNTRNYIQYFIITNVFLLLTINLLSPQNKTVRSWLLVSSFYRWGNWGTGK